MVRIQPREQTDQIAPDDLGERHQLWHRQRHVSDKSTAQPLLVLAHLCGYSRLRQPTARDLRADVPEDHGVFLVVTLDWLHALYRHTLTLHAQRYNV